MRLPQIRNEEAVHKHNAFLAQASVRELEKQFCTVRKALSIAEEADEKHNQEHSIFLKHCSAFTASAAAAATTL